MEKLGIEPVQLLTQLFNFGLMVFILAKLLYKPVQKTLAERRKKIAEGLEYAEKMKLEIEKTESRRQAVVASAKEEARKIIEDAKKAAKLVEAEIMEKAHAEAQLVVEKGRADIEMEREEMRKRLTEQTLDAATAIVRKILETSLTAAEQRKIIDQKIKTLGRQLGES